MSERQGVKAFFALPPPLWEQVRTAAGAFCVLALIGYAVGLARPDALSALLTRFADAAGELLDSRSSGAALLWAVFTNNLVSLCFAVAMGFLPFLRLPALTLGLNALLFGGFAAYYQKSGLGLAAYLAGTLPHGIAELPALILACGAGLYLCRAVSDGLRARPNAPPVRQAFAVCLRVCVRAVAPLLLLAAALEVFVTPSIFARFLPA